MTSPASSAQLLGRAVGPGEVRHQLHDAVGQVGDPVVVGRHDHHPSRRRQLPQQLQHALHLDVVEVGGGLVGEHQGRVVHEGTGDGDPLLLAARQLAGRWWPRSPSPTRSRSSVARVAGLLADMPASRIGATTLPWAREARDQVEGLEHHADGVAAVGGEVAAGEAGTSPGRRAVIEPEVGVSRPARHDSSVVLPHPEGPSRTTSSPSSASKVEAVERPHDVAAGAELDGEVADLERAHAAAAKALEGSTAMALRSATRLDSSPTTIATIGQHHEGARGHGDRQGEHRLEELGGDHREDGGQQVMMTACAATPKKSSRDDEPSDFSTAKSRSRSSDETYISAATMIAATTHMRARELSIDEMASAMACTVSSSTSAELSTTRSAGGVGRASRW